MFARELGDILISALSILLSFVDDGSLMLSDWFNWLSPSSRAEEALHLNGKEEVLLSAFIFMCLEQQPHVWTTDAL